MRIRFNPDGIQSGGVLTPAERAIYIDLCRQLTSRDPTLDYPDITRRLLEITHREVLAMIPPEYLADERTYVEAEINRYFGAVPADDLNFVGKINLVCLQCILLFTEHSMDTSTTFPANLNDAYFYYRQLQSIDWRDYVTLRTFIQTHHTDLAAQVSDLLYIGYSKRLYTTSVPKNNKIFLITILDFFSITEMIELYLDNVIVCGMISKFDYADGRFLAPYEFLEHDITHGNNYTYICSGRATVDTEDIQQFYTYCLSIGISPKELYRVKLMIFLLIHESGCDFFPDYGHITVDEILERITTTSLIDIERFLDYNNLGQMIPADIRGDRDKTLEYLRDCSRLYKIQLDAWRVATGRLQAPKQSAAAAGGGAAGGGGGKARKARKARTTVKGRIYRKKTARRGLKSRRILYYK